MTRLRAGFLERNLEELFGAMERALYAEQTARGNGLLQRLDPRVKVSGLLALIVSAALAARLWVVAAIFLAAIALALVSKVSLNTLMGRVWVGALTLTGPVALPAIFLTGTTVLYKFPVAGWAVTREGLTSACFLILRVETAATLALLLVFTTPWMHVLKALRVLRVPVVFVVVLGMTCRYILLMLEMAHDMFEARQSRTVGPSTSAERRRMAISGAGVLLSKTFRLSNEVYLAMQARGFRGEVYLLDDFRMRAGDWMALTGFALLAGAAAWAGR
jgi:cobalt ECF transporter T component CbiQ